jgi:hypothetical protein
MPVSEGLVLHEGDTLVVRGGGACSGFTPMGEPFELRGPAELVLVQSSAASALDKVASWIRLQIAHWTGESRRRPLAARALRDWKVQILAPQPLVPASDGCVRPGRSRFRWTLVPGVDAYDVTVAPATGEASTRRVRDTSLLLEDLTPGEPYVWKVRPVAEAWSMEIPWRGFRVMTRGEESRLDEALTHLDDLKAGVLLLAAGLHEEAIYRFDVALSVAEHARAARLWRAEALAAIGLHKQAYEDLVEARGQ